MTQGNIDVHSFNLHCTKLENSKIFKKPYHVSGVFCRKEELKAAWRELDKDLTGTLNSHEASQLLVEECCIDEKMAKSLFEDFDQDKDGKLNREEFEKLFISLFG